jgi:CBS domain-containing protein
MKKAIDKLTAAGVMGDVVITVPEAMSVHGADRLMAEAGAHAAPVTDAAGRGVGTPRASDVARRPADPAKPTPADYWTEWQMKGVPPGA